MPINSDKPHLWKEDAARSIDFYNDWFLRFAPETYRRQRIIRTKEVLDAFRKTGNLTRITPRVLEENPGILPILRMTTAPPLARDRLVGLAYLNKTMVVSMEGKDDKPPCLPVRMNKSELMEGLQRICDIVIELSDRDVLTWLESNNKPKKTIVDRAAAVIADRLCGAASDPIIRNAQEKRQLAALQKWLSRHGYKKIKTEDAMNIEEMPPGTFTFHLTLSAGKKTSPVNIPIDCVVKRLDAGRNELPVLIEAKSAGDATNTNKRRKEEAQKFTQLKERYGKDVVFLLLLCGYFEAGYLGYEASEGIDWVWEHRLDDLAAIFLPQDKKKTSTVSENVTAYYSSEPDEDEAVRFDRQHRIDNSKSQGERNRLGQFSTPYPLACQIVSRALDELPSSASLSFLEPALGTGVFFSALRHEAANRRIIEAEGVEPDTSYAQISSDIFGDKGLSVRVQDFFAFSRMPENFSRFNLLCTNPPYVRHHHIPSAFKQELQVRVNEELGIKVGGLTGLYVYFVLLADKLLSENAVASWLLPAEFLYVNYGQPLRDYLSKRVSLISIHHFDPEAVQFNDALVSSCIVTYKKKHPSSLSSFVFSAGERIENPREVKVIDLGEFSSSHKWTMPYFEEQELSDNDRYVLEDFFDVRRGIATGANDFFIVDQNIIEEFSIPRLFLKPILPGPRFLSQDIVETKPDGLPDMPKASFLLDCDIPPALVHARHPGLWAYLQRGIERGIHERYLCASREVWYFQEKRPPSLYLATYMGRSNGSGKCPIRFFLNLSQAIATNVYLHLYPKPELLDMIVGNELKLKKLLDVLNGIPSDEFLREGRAYGGGLHKMEPGELRKVRLINPPEWLRCIRGGRQLSMT